MAYNHLGSICGIIPRRVGVIASAILCMLIGFGVMAHTVFKTIQVMLAYKPALVGCEANPEGPGCSMVYDWLTCEHTAGYTHTAQHWTTMVIFPIMGYIGLRGVMGRDQLDIELFSWFYLFVGVLNVVTLAVDGYYTHVCGHLPDWPLSILYGLYPEKMNQLYRLGHNPALASPRDIEHVVGMDALTMVVLLTIFVIAYNLYMASQVATLAKVASGGPCGLGPMYGLEVSGDLSREFNHCVNDLMDSMKKGVEDGSHITLPITNSFMRFAGSVDLCAAVAAAVASRPAIWSMTAGPPGCCLWNFVTS